MIRGLAALTVVAAGALAAAGAGAADTVDLTRRGAMEELRTSNPEHFEKISEIDQGLFAQPERAEGDWLQVTFDARDVDLSRLLILTSDPPKQTLSFTLDDVRYRMHVVRSDLGAEVMPAK